MALPSYSQSLYQGARQRPQTTAHLAQTMSLLGLNSQELSQKVEAALAANPALELLEGRHCPICGRKLRGESVCPTCIGAKKMTQGEEPLVFVAPPDTGFSGEGRSGEELPEDYSGAQPETLSTFVLRQIASELEPLEQEIAAHILTSLDEDGLLPIPLLEIARYHHVPLVTVEEVAQRIQTADPLGVGASTPTEALLVQLQSLGNQAPNPELCIKAIREGMGLLGKRQYAELGHLLGVSKTKAEQIAEFITNNLSPYPARSHWGSLRTPNTDGPTRYTRPDIIVGEQESGRLVVEVMWPLRGLLRVNPLFQEALREAPEDKAEQWKVDLEQANLLIKCLAQRNHTIVRLMQILAVLQRKFIKGGDAHLKPITRASIADELGVHESTISRAVSGKSVQLPSGKIVPLSQFFDRSLHVRTALKQLIKQEPKPLSDTRLAKLLEKEGFSVARRTVAKYRMMEGILPAHMRKAQAI
jgi:RNA polymerase sigma-54 factor